jgi:DNA excision repair protein ERCC-8
MSDPKFFTSVLEKEIARSVDVCDVAISLQYRMKDSVSISFLLQGRIEGRCDAKKFSYCMARKRSRLERQRHPRLFNPQGTPVLSMDTADNGRYLLTGDKRGSICIYDMSPWGSQSRQIAVHPYHTEADKSSFQTHRPVQQAIAPLSRFIVSCRWYPIDSGMFFSCSRSGGFHVWDTNEMLPVLECKPFQFDDPSDQQSSSMSCMEISSSSLSIAVGSPTSSLIKLIDIRSGSSSHSLTGHEKGVSSIAWSPICPFVLASGGMDSCVMLWDIRKGGSRGRIAVLDMDRQRVDPYVSRPFFADGTHLRESRHRTGKSKASSSMRLKHSSPNNYYGDRQSDRSLPLSHMGGCVGVAFDPSGHFLVSAGGNGDLSIWDLRGTACKLPRRFVSSRGTKPVDSSYLGRAPLVPVPQGSGDTTIWTCSGSELCGFSLHDGGAPTSVLKGHIGAVSAISHITGTGSLVSSSSDGLLLLWGPSSETATRRRGKRLAGDDQDNW